MINTEIKIACIKALSAGVPFACFRFPKSNEVRFIADDGRDSRPVSETVFEIGPWLAPYSERLTVRDMVPLGDFMKAEISSRPKSDTEDDFSPEQALSRQEYLDRVSDVIRNCRLRDGKTVFSRIIAISNPRLDIPEAAEQLFDRFPEAFGFLYYHPSTGCWLGATPETLLSADLRLGTFRTMALAGTRPATPNANSATVPPDKPWDKKNIRENSFVVDFFATKFKALGLSHSISPVETVTYGKIQHICRRIEGHFNPTDPQAIPRIIDTINPTPALCGTPPEAAVRDISEFEKGPRRCYGGFVAVRTPDRFDAFVNLRSAQVAADGTGRCLLHAGGGITPDSVPEEEFEESAAKASALLSILARKTEPEPAAKS